MKKKLQLIMLTSSIAMLTGLSWAETNSASSTNRLPEVSVVGKPPLAEDAPVGPYQQPEWTTARRFATTRVYLQQQPWGFGLEQWVKAQWPRGESPNFLFQEELEIGLPHRIQMDLYENWRVSSKDGYQQDSFAAEARWALADWGKLPFNPTLYGEWKFVNPDLGADTYELKLLLGDSLTPRIHWGLNLIYEQEVGGVRTTEYAVSGGIGYTLIDEKLNVGVEFKVESATEQGNRSAAPIEVDIGPSVQWRPTPNTHIDIVPLVGVTSDSPRVETWLVAGWDFGPGNAKSSSYTPVSLKSQ
jgi:hypothetical protein